MVSKIDYCNCLLAGTPANLTDKLQSVMLMQQPRIVCGFKKYDHITSHMRESLHWLRIPQRVTFKLYVYSHTNLSCAPYYLTELCIPVARSEPRRRLRYQLPSAISPSREQQHRSATGPSHMLDHKHGIVFHHSSELQRLCMCSKNC